MIGTARKYSYLKISHIENESKCVCLYSKYESPEESELHEIDVVSGYKISGIPSKDIEDNSKNNDVFFEYNSKTEIGFEKLRLYETKTYYCEFNNIHLRFQNENELKPIQNASNQKTFNVVNYLGKSAFLIDENIRIPFEIIPLKIHYEDDYVKLTNDIADKCSQLLLDYSSPTNLNFIQLTSKSKKTPLETFIFLRKFCSSENIEYLMQYIKNNPDRMLVSENELRPFGTGPISKRFYTNPFSNSKNWNRVKDGSYLPELITTCRKYDSYNTPANQFIKYAFLVFIQVCENLIERLNNECSYKDEALYLKETLETVLLDSLFDDVQDLSSMPLNNQVLQKREGYSQIFSAFNMLDLAMQLDWEGERNIYEGQSRNVALLYEYWLVFVILEILKKLGGKVEFDISEDENLKKMFSKENGLLISLREGQTSYYSVLFKEKNIRVKFFYNRTFKNTGFNGTDYKGSYSRDFRPDYTLAIFPAFDKGNHKITEKKAIERGDVSYIHFDAKYRVTDIVSLFGKETKQIINEKREDSSSLGKTDEELENEYLTAEKKEETKNTYNRGDLLKMHTYNDAIRKTVGSYVLYPGNNNQETKFQVYDELLPGVGAFAVKPGDKTRVGIDTLEKFILGVINFKSEQCSRQYRNEYFENMILQTPSLKQEFVNKQENSTLVMIGYVSNEYNEYLKENGYLPIDKNSLGDKDYFYFYFRAIENGKVYTLHKETFQANYLRFTTKNLFELDNYDKYKFEELEPWTAKIQSITLVTQKELPEEIKEYARLKNHTFSADYYYVVKAKKPPYCNEGIVAISTEENAIISPYSPKIVQLYDGNETDS